MKIDPDQTLVIANPAAAGGMVGRRWDSICGLLRGILGPVEIRRTERRGHATALAREALWGGCELVLSLGGDGTHGEVAAGLLRDGPAPDSVTLGILPVGSGGDFRRMLYGSNRLEDHARRLVTAEAHPIDVGVVRCVDPGGGPVRRTFLNEVSVGTSGLVCRHVNASRKRLGGRMSYFVNSLRALAEYEKVPMTITLDGVPAGEFLPTMVMIGNGRYAGAGMQLTPEARLADGMLDVTVMQDNGYLDGALSAPHLYLGTLVRSGRARHLRGHKIRVECPLDEVPAAPIVEADGDPIGTLPLESTVIFEALRVLGVRPDLL